MSEISRIFPLEPRAPEPRSPEPRSLEPRSPEPRSLEPLWREVLGSRLRALRGDRDETLAQTAERAGISPQYLSEVERGRKEASSEMIAALAGALGVTVAELMAGAAEDLRRAALVVQGTVLSAPVTGRAAVPVRSLGQRPSGPVALAMAA
jgi:transcriptional regulator with XRE-family HTH domain